MKSVTTLFLGATIVSSMLASAEETKTSPQQPQAGESVILFLLDNSASLPPLDPDTKRRDAIEKIYSFLKGQPYRLILFGGRNEIYVDAPQHYRNAGKWTDFFFAFQAVREVAAEYPDDTDLKVVLITDGMIDPSPREWRDQSIPKGVDLRAEAGSRTVRLLENLRLPLYVILIGEEVDYELIQRMVVGANGSIAASDYAQGIADFFRRRRSSLASIHLSPRSGRRSRRDRADRHSHRDPACTESGVRDCGRTVRRDCPSGRRRRPFVPRLRRP